MENQGIGTGHHEVTGIIRSWFSEGQSYNYMPYEPILVHLPTLHQGMIIDITPPLIDLDFDLLPEDVVFMNSCITISIKD